MLFLRTRTTGIRSKVAVPTDRERTSKSQVVDLLPTQRTANVEVSQVVDLLRVVANTSSRQLKRMMRKSGKFLRFSNSVKEIIAKFSNCVPVELQRGTRRNDQRGPRLCQSKFCEKYQIKFVLFCRQQSFQLPSCLMSRLNPVE